MLEKTVETYLVDRVRAAGGDAYKFTSPQRRSVPDRIVAFPPGRLYFVELKRPGNKPTKPQLREHERLRALGCDVRVIDSREAVDAFVREASVPPAPYLHVYEYPSPFGGTHREFSPTTWNGQQPARAVALYARPQLVAAPVEKRSTIDAIIALENAKMSIAMEAKPITHESLISESVVKDSASKVSQTAPNVGQGSATEAYASCAGVVIQPAPAPADERAAMQDAFERSEFYFNGESPAERASNWKIWVAAWKAARRPVRTFVKDIITGVAAQYRDQGMNKIAGEILSLIDVERVAAPALTDEQREAIDFVIGWYEQSTIADNPYRTHIKALRALLARGAA
ncbi:VRR-NUC domain-containing protein [Burkholderia vietnamiensis]|uniref:VRR-NUC domain-containing protein n=1 Tax=Burkholderia vietnamiensis TaxID=60552 RepID=UPI000B1124B8|nr:VRR-NUC domain-containing protein [Burkholderia vietnamiensis]